MNAITSVVKNGRIELVVPPDWPDGCEVVIEPVLQKPLSVGLDESDWHEDPASLADWDAWLTTIEPLEFTAEEEVAFAQFAEGMRRFNVEAVRQQMQEGTRR
jgi:hypothetical protein